MIIRTTAMYKKRLLSCAKASDSHTSEGKRPVILLLTFFEAQVKGGELHVSFPNSAVLIKVVIVTHLSVIKGLSSLTCHCVTC